MFIARRDSATLLCSEKRHSFELTWNRPAALPNRAGGGWLAGYKHCTPTEWGALTLFLFAFLFLQVALSISDNQIDSISPVVSPAIFHSQV